jgi:flagellar motor switch/type III secretory pathway protein FliN
MSAAAVAVVAPKNDVPPTENGTTVGNQKKEARWQSAMNLPCVLSVDLPLPKFTVSDCLALRVGSVLRTSWSTARDVPLRANGVVIGWCELEAPGAHVAIRMTELA